LLPQQLDLPNSSVVPALSGGRTEGNVTSSKVTYKAGVESTPSDHVAAYFNVTSGYKAGGLNLGPTVAADSFIYQPETNTSYELGLKTRLLDNRVSINSAIFDTEYKNIQVTQLQRNGFANVTTNAARARMYGLELEGQWQITATDRFGGFFNYLHATYVDYKDGIDQQTSIVYPSLDGNHLPFAPVFSGRAQYTHEISLANGGRILATGAVFWQATSYLREFNLPVDRVPAYSKTDAELQYIFPQGRFTATAFGHNLENRAVRSSSFTLLGDYFSSYNPPRTYGIRIAYKY
jgi:iron complex outermembrane receptor protein